MASWQAHAIDAALRLFVKRRMPQDIDIPRLRAQIEKFAQRPPKGVRISQARVGCLGEWVEVPPDRADQPRLWPEPEASPPRSELSDKTSRGNGKYNEIRHGN